MIAIEFGRMEAGDGNDEVMDGVLRAAVKISWTTMKMILEEAKGLAPAEFVEPG